MPYRLEGHFIEACDCFTICPCWIDGEPDEDECTGLFVWEITAGSVDGVAVSGLNAASISFHTGKRSNAKQRVACRSSTRRRTKIKRRHSPQCSAASTAVRSANWATCSATFRRLFLRRSRSRGTPTDPRSRSDRMPRSARSPESARRDDRSRSSTVHSPEYSGRRHRSACPRNTMSMSAAPTSTSPSRAARLPTGCSTTRVDRMTAASNSPMLHERPAVPSVRGLLVATWVVAAARGWH